MALMSRIDLTPAQSEALRIIADRGPLALRDLGNMLVCDSGTNPSRIVDRLVAAGLVQRNASEQDRRQIRLTVTRQGQHKAAQVLLIENQLYNLIDGALSTEDAHVLVRSLRALTQDTPAGAALNKRLATERRPT